MSIPGSASPLFFQTAAADAAAAGPIKSVRFNSADSAYLNRTPSSAGSNTTWTLSAWVKKAGNDNHIFGAGAGNTPGRFGFGFNGSDKIFAFIIASNSTVFSITTDAVFRDPAAWYHLVLIADTGNSTQADRFKIYVNGVLQSVSGTLMPSSQNTFVNTTAAHTFGRRSYTASDYFNGYLTDVYLIDGTAKDVSDFGAFDDNGVWQSATYSGTFGTNGFHLFDFANESGIGNDSSGNDNDFTVNNINASSGSTLSPSVYGNFASGSLAGAFDGSTASGDRIGVRPNGSGVSFTAQTVNTKLRVYCGVESGQGTLYINKTINTGEAPSRSSPSYVDVTSDLGTLPFTLTDVGFHGGGGGAGADIYAIEVDNTVLVNTSFTGDVLFDVPTNGDSSNDTGAGGEVSGNYCTWNPLVKPYAGAFVFKNGNMEAHNAASTYGVVMGTIPMSSGKWYWEVTVNGTPNNTYDYIGIVGADSGIAYPTLTTIMPNQLWYRAGGTKLNGNTSSSYGATYGDGDVIGVALDLDSATKTLTFYKNGTSQGTAFSGSLLDKTWVCAVGDYSNALTTTSWNANWGQRAFAHSAPSGFKALCTTNLADPTVADGSDGFETKLWTGSGNNRTISGFSFSPDLVWIKNRVRGTDFELYDTRRGAQNVLKSSNADAEGADVSGLLSFTSDGFTLGDGGGVNKSNEATVGWVWDAGTSNASNTDGDVTSSVRANQTTGFSIVTWTGVSQTNLEIGHGLGAEPHMIVAKKRNVGTNWVVYHKSIGNNKYLRLNGTLTATDDDVWGDTTPTSTVFTVNKSDSGTGTNDTYVAYCFASVAGYSAYGQYTGNGDLNGEGPFQYCGFRPAWILIKSDSSSEDWVIYDTARGPENVVDNVLRPGRDNVEATASERNLDIVSNGFRVKGYEGSINGSGKTYVWWAIAKNPFQANGGLAR